MFALVDNFGTDYSPVRTPGVKMSDGRGISGLEIQGSENESSLDVTLFRELNSKQEIKVTESATANELLNKICGWAVSDAEILSINGAGVGKVDTGIPESNSSANYTSADGDYVVERVHVSQPSQGWTGEFFVDGVKFDVESTTEEDLVEFYSIVLKYLNRV